MPSPSPQVLPAVLRGVFPMRSHRWACVCHTSAWHGCVPVIDTGRPSSASARGLAPVSHGPALPAPFCLSCRTCLTPCAKPGRRRKRRVTWFPSRDGDMPPGSCARGVWSGSLSTQRVFLRDESSGSSQGTALKLAKGHCQRSRFLQIMSQTLCSHGCSCKRSRKPGKSPSS